MEGEAVSACTNRFGPPDLPDDDCLPCSKTDVAGHRGMHFWLSEEGKVMAAWESGTKWDRVVAASSVREHVVDVVMSGSLGPNPVEWQESVNRQVATWIVDALAEAGLLADEPSPGVAAVRGARVAA